MAIPLIYGFPRRVRTRSTRFGMQNLGGARLPKDRRTLPGLNMFRHRSTILSRQTRRAVPRMCHHLQCDRTIDQTARQRSGIAPRFGFLGTTRLRENRIVLPEPRPTDVARRLFKCRQANLHLLFAICHCRVAASPYHSNPAAAKSANNASRCAEERGTNGGRIFSQPGSFRDSAKIAFNAGITGYFRSVRP